MLLHPISKALWSKFLPAPANWLIQNKNLIGRAALIIYRKCGKQEAQTFINLMRLSMIVDI